MAAKNFSLLAVLALSSCAAFTPTEEIANTQEQTQDTDVSQALSDDSPLASSVSFQKQFKQNFQQQNDIATGVNLKQSLQNSKEHNINYYVRGLMQDLVANLQYVNSTTPVAVVSFVMLDSDYNDANLLGIQIAESLIHEVHKFGIPVIDFKTTGYIRVTEQGDFAFSKDYEDFSGEMPARYIVGGTMLKNTDGYLINARIVGVKSQAVVASAQSFIPNSVADPIIMLAAETKEPPTLQNQPMTKFAKRYSSNKVDLIQ
ncbi:FlgO family outer membrane protein [uncultured Paraglaciecola sp.]|uniref:FlgO family outer membrane protein n=1 Tax=uncultured Paraglaciecola sp. TaxID=1765024 RepID=UPI0030DD2B46|tara:strand:+ start:17546 stop:18322 length:777 start_codon:yes stop_codon:yes gene_type:complete